MNSFVPAAEVEQVGHESGQDQIVLDVEDGRLHDDASPPGTQAAAIYIYEHSLGFAKMRAFDD
ncbi:MAG: hypothetical protein QOG00_2521 [Pyrinomonadaceae bacterium]|nr:hypothetical protein [Pyrinomonadaceae bacterium]